ncbi:MAG TPA: hypothetical protein VKB58_01730 [Terriglobales bacterium]|nr:hypothetical protein [Terriglobales bacterium]
MRSRMSALVLSFLLAATLLGCNKKTDQAQNENQPATTSDNSSAQGSQPGGNMSQSAPAQQQQQQMAQAPVQQAAPAPPPPPPPPPPLVVPAGTSLVIRMGNTIDTKTANAGDSFTGTLAQSVAVDGVVAIPSGAGVAGTVVESKSPGRFKGAGDLAITLTSINVHGVPTSIETSTYTQTVKGKGKRTAVMAGGGTGAGALIGGLAGGGKGALIGGLIGAGAGTAGAAFTGNKDLQVPAESVVTFKLANSITVKRSSKHSSDEQPAQ